MISICTALGHRWQGVTVCLLMLVLLGATAVHAQDRPTLTVPTVSVGPISSTEATVTWVANDVAGCAATQYIVYIVHASGSYASDPVYVAASEPLRVTFRHLTPTHQYYVTVGITQSTCGQQAGARSATYFTTLRAAPTDTPVPMDTHTPVPPTHTPRPTDIPRLTVPTVSVGPISSTEATVTWVANDVAGCAATQYIVYIVHASGSYASDPVYVAASEPLRVTFRHLTPTHQYYVTVGITQSTCGQQAGARSATYFTTLRAAPAATPVPMDTHTPIPPTHTPVPPANTPVTIPAVGAPHPPKNVTLVVGSTEARITWVAGDPGKCALHSYRIAVFDDRSKFNANIRDRDRDYVAGGEVSASGPLSFTIRNLKPETSYNWDIYAVDSCDEHSIIRWNYFTTLAGSVALPTPPPAVRERPLPPKEVTVVVGSTEARLVSVTGVFQHYEYWLFDTGTRLYGRSWQIRAPDDAVFPTPKPWTPKPWYNTIRNLKPETTYYLDIRSRGLWSAPSILTRVRFTTLAGAVALPTPAPPDTPTPVPHEQP